MSGNSEPMLKPAELARHFAAAGIKAGDNLILHSSFKSLGKVAGGPSTVVDSLLEVLGSQGNLMTPTFTYCFPMWNVEPFDLVRSKSRTGAISEAVRLRPEARRSFHPSHSVAVIGPDAEEIVSDHLDSTPLGAGSPFEKMHKSDAKILMLGTFQDTNSSLHYCEAMAGLPYTSIPFSNRQDFETAWFLNGSGRVEYLRITEVPGCSRGFRVVEPLLRQRGVLRDVQIGAAASQLLDLRELVDAMLELLRDDPGMLLCHTATCTICPKRRISIGSRR